MSSNFSVYTISFFGHRCLYDFFEIEEWLKDFLTETIKEKEYVEFLVGRDGDFDIVVASCIRNRKKELYSCNSSLIWIMLYKKAEYMNNIEEFSKYYDEIEVVLSHRQHTIRKPFQLEIEIW